MNISIIRKGEWDTTNVLQEKEKRTAYSRGRLVARCWSGIKHCNKIKQEHRRGWESSYDSCQKLTGEGRTIAYNAARVGGFNSSLKGDRTTSYNQNSCQSFCIR
jgi:hypothetical protein